MKQRAVRGESKRSLTLRRSKRAEPRAAMRTQEDPRRVGEGQSSRVPSAGAGGLHSGDEPQMRECAPPLSENLPYDPVSDLPPSVSSSEVETVEPELSHYKGLALKNVGRDSRGRVIPHKRSEQTAQQVAIWVAGGYDLNAIAVRMNIRPGLVKECYGRELATGADQVGMEVTEHIVARTKKSDRMAIFFAKAKMGWRDGESKPLDTGVLNIHIHV